ncbi:MAG: VanZ family protein [Clostridia bacterium]|nr:VanZ family protein [Clostridia bacterium]
MITAVIFYTSLSNGSQSEKQSGQVENIISKIMKFLTFNKLALDEYAWFSIVVRKGIGHFSLFFTLAIFAFVVYYRLAEVIKKDKSLYLFIILTIGAGIITAGVSEFLQSPIFVSGRAPSVVDALINVLGYTLSTVICLSIYNIRKSYMRLTFRSSKSDH